MNCSTPQARPRILEVLYSFAFGGSEIVGVELAKGLSESGLDVLCTAIDSTPGPLQQRCAQYGIRTLNLNIPAGILGRNGISLALTKWLRSLHLDAVHLHHFLGLNKLGIPARLAGIRKVVVTEHSVLDVSQSLAGRMRARVSWRLASGVTVIHQSIKDYLCTEIGVAADRIAVIPIGIILEDYARIDRPECRAALNLGAQITFVFVGRLAPVKNVPGLIAAFLAVQSRRPANAKLLIVGDGEDRAACENLVKSSEHGNCVELAGAQVDPRRYLAASDVFVLNSRSEGTPRALLEAMATGLPAIGPAVGGIPDMLKGRGWLTIPGDQSSLESAIESVLNHPHAIPMLGQLARQYVKSNFDSQRATARYRELLVG